jgi:hypothetical protein
MQNKKKAGVMPFSANIFSLKGSCVINNFVKTELEERGTVS